MDYIVLPDLVDGCQMSCALCWNRNRRGSMENMSLDTVKKIVEKHGHALMCWYNWGEPLLHKQFVEVSEIIKPTGSFISSNFSLHLSDKYLYALSNWKRVYISISGMTQDVYEIYNKGGNLKLVFSNIERFMSLKSPETVTILRWESHPRNQHQYQTALEFCRNKNIAFEPITLNCEVEDLLEGFDHELLKKPLFSEAQTGCGLLDQFPIGADGSYLLCCASHNVTTGYSVYDDISMEELLQVRMNLDLCKTCREHGIFKSYF